MSGAIGQLCPGAASGPNEIIMFGPRGMGKTTMLNWGMAECRKVDFGEAGDINVIRRRSGLGMNDPANVVKSLVELGKVDGLLSWLGFSLRRPDELSIPGVAKWVAPEEPFYDALADAIIEECRTRPKALFIDEAQDLSLESKRFIFSISNTVSLEAPFLLVLAGTPGLKRELTDAGETYIERAEKLPMRNLDSESAAKALLIPFKRAEVGFAPGALERIVDESQCYPFFLQKWGKRMWDHAESTGADVITMDVVENSVDAMESFRRGFYADRYVKLSEDRDLLGAALAIASAWRDGMRPDFNDVSAMVRDSLPRRDGDRDEKADALVKRIEKYDMVWRPGEIFEPGIPSFLTYMHEMARSRERGSGGRG